MGKANNGLTLLLALFSRADYHVQINFVKNKKYILDLFWNGELSHVTRRRIKQVDAVCVSGKHQAKAHVKDSTSDKTLLLIS